MFPGKRAEEIASEVKNIKVQLHPTHVIIHAGTNNQLLNQKDFESPV